MVQENRVIFLLIPKLPSALAAGDGSPLHCGRFGEELPVPTAPTQPLSGVEPHSASPELNHYIDGAIQFSGDIPVVFCNQ
jgi:hypothetical protein